MMAMHRLQDAMGQSAASKAEQEEKVKLRGEVEQYKREAEAVSLHANSTDTPGAGRSSLAKLSLLRLQENADQVLNTEAEE